MRSKYESKKNIHPVFFNQINKELRDWKYKFCRQVSMEGVSIAQHLNGSFRLFLRPRKATAPDFSFVFFLINNNPDYFSSPIFGNPWLQYFHWNIGGHDSTLLSWGYYTFEALIAGRPINLWRKNKLNKKIAKPGFESAPAGWAGGPGTTHALIHHLPTRGRQYKVKRDGNANTQRQRQRNKYERKFFKFITVSGSTRSKGTAMKENS